jgi:magnesium transporter
MEFEVTEDFIRSIQEAIASRNEVLIHEKMEDLHAADISGILHELDTDESRYVLSLLNKEVGAEIISSLDEDMRKRFLRAFSPKELAQYIAHADSDDAVDIINEQPIKIREEIIALVESENKEKANHIKDLLHYEEDCAGGLMAKELIRANINWTITQCIEEIRRQSKKVDKIYSVYVVDNNDKLLGIVSLKKMLLAGDDTKIADIYTSDIISVESYKPAEEVAEMMQKYDLESIPVVNVHGNLLGRITIDDVVDVITEQAEQDIQMMAGISDSAEEDANVWRLSRVRLPWLLVGMLGGILGARFIGFFEDDIILIPAMAFFIPLITATGGNVGIQSSSVVVQSLANKSGIGAFNSEKLLKVFLVALVNGIAISALVFLINLAIGEDIRLAMVVSIALLSVVVLASFMGTITPLVLDKAGVNPAIASGPFITTANDLLGLGIYFFVAHTLYHL